MLVVVILAELYKVRDIWEVENNGVFREIN